MKTTKLFKLVAMFSLLIVGGIACDDIFDVQPADSISIDVALGTEAGIDGIRTSMYDKLIRSFDMTTEHFIGPSALADETCNRQGSTRFQALCTAQGTSGNAHIGAFGAYNIIQDANILINAIPDGVVSAAKKDQYIGEALVIRALAYHSLVRSYGYEPGNFSQGPVANWDLGVMLRTEAVLDLEQAQPIPRSTVNEVYTQIITDLTDAIAILPAGGDNSYANREFAQGLLARVYLYQGDWSNAASQAAAAIAASGLALQSTPAGVDDMWNMPNPEALFELTVNASTENIAGSNANAGLAVYTSQQWVSQVPTNYTMNLYDPADYRLGWYSHCNTVGTAGCEATNDDTLKVDKWSGWKGNYVNNIPYMRIAELYLIEAEAAAKAANDPDAGLAALNTLRTARGLTAFPAGTFATVGDLEDEILAERTRELVVEGHRFWDLKRLGRNVLDGSGNIKIRADSYRILAPFGTGYQGVNPLFVENPEYEVLADD